MKPFIFFYIPVYNEQETAGILLYRLREVMQKLRHDYTVLLTLDGCSDETSEVVAPYLQVMPVRVIHRMSRIGYGRSLLEVVKRVSKESKNPRRDFFLVLDADFSHDPALLNELSGQIERSIELCYGNRLAAGQNGLGLRKTAANFFFQQLMRFKGIRLKNRTDLFSTLQGCRVQLLRRNLNRFQVLDRCGPEIPPAGAAMLFYLLLSGNARQYFQFKFSEKGIRRRSSRFRIFPLLKLVLFWDLLKIKEESKRPTPPRRHRSGGRQRWKSNKKQPGSSKA